MITFVEGIIEEKTHSKVILNVNGIGYEVFIPVSTYDHIPKEGEFCRLLTFEYLREDQHTLFGFFSAKERLFFELLTNVSGIGPKIAISILSSLPHALLRKAIIEDETKILTTVPGIGKKTAERLILELRDKVAKEFPFAETDVSSGSSDHDSSEAASALQALISLGYKQAEAHRMVNVALKETDGDVPVEEIVRLALRASSL